MRNLSDQKGIAMVTALLLTLVSLVVISALLYLLTQQTKSSAAQKTYTSAREAAYGDVTIASQEIFPKLFAHYSTNKLKTQYAALKFDSAQNDVCLKQKLTTDTSSWGLLCPADPSPLDPKTLPDVVITLKGTPSNFRVYNKIVDTRAGNTDPNSSSDIAGTVLAGAGVTMSSNPAITPPHIPYLFTIEVQAEREINPKEKANLSVLYAY